MSANTSPIFVATPHIGSVRVNTANTAHDGSGSLATIITGTTNGTRIDKIVLSATSTTTAGMVRFYIDDLTNIRFWREVPVTAATPSGTVQQFTFTIFSADLQSPLLVLPSTYILKCAPHNAESFDVIAFGGDF
jgi:hypothetical protein